MLLNFNNAEELVFADPAACKLFPEFAGLFQQWRLGRTVPGMRQMSKRAVLSFLSRADAAVLERHFGERVHVDRGLCGGVSELSSLLGGAGEMMNAENPLGYFALYRNRERLLVTLWR